LTHGSLALWAWALGCFGCCIGLGLYVRTRPLTRLDLAARALRGAGTPLAAAFTQLGRWYAVAGLGFAVAASAMLCGTNPLPVFTLLGSQILCQGAVGVVKRFFRRGRPEYWLLRRERDLSYPSGHSATAIVFFVPLTALAVYANVVPAAAGFPLACAFALCVIGIPWSRLALGAHYPTDVIGGLLFGTGWLCATLALLTPR
jgi:undecaprenyl-diphosphatase